MERQAEQDAADTERCPTGGEKVRKKYEPAKHFAKNFGSVADLYYLCIKKQLMITEEQREMMSVLRGLMEKKGMDTSDKEVMKMMERLHLHEESTSAATYTYEHPDYGPLITEVPECLQPLLDTGDDHDRLPPHEDIVAYCSELDHDTLAAAVSSIIYFRLDRWHRAGNNRGESDVWLYPIPLAILLAEKYGLRECLPALLEIERQEREFAETFFDNSDLSGMVAACIYRIVTEDDLPLLADFARERGIHSFCKAEVIAAVATLPRRKPQLLPKVQQWLFDLLSVFADEIDPAVGDVLLLEAIVHCCIHTRCEVAKPMIIRMYSKYKMPNILIPGGVNEVRKTIKKADIGVLDEFKDSAETIYDFRYLPEELDDDEDYDDEEYGDDEDEYYDDEGLSPRQEYCGWAMGGKARYLPVHSLKKYTLRIELRQSEPLIWREIEVPSSICLVSLAQTILLAMGWDEDHMHLFAAEKKGQYATSQNELSEPLYPGVKDGSRYGISHLLQKEGDSIGFEYDYGDSWYHEVTLIAKTDYAKDEAKEVVLTGGANACPPDDCGGIYRYNYLVQLMQEKPRSRALSDFYEWMGSKWDPEFFPMEVAAKAVSRMNGR